MTKSSLDNETERNPAPSRQSGTGARVALNQFLQDNETIVLDTMVFIYQFEVHPYFSKFTHIIFTTLEKGLSKGIISTITLHEILVKPKKENDTLLALQYKHLLTHSPVLTVTGITADIADLAAGVRAKYNFTAPDALVIASGIASKATGLITADKKLKALKELSTFILE